jgi:hypothetical protein
VTNSLSESKNLHFRPLWTNDLARIDEIYQKFYAEDFWLPDLTNTIGNGVVSKGNEIIAFGMVRLFPEAIILIDKDKSPRVKVEALKILYEEAIKACKRHGFNELYCKISDDRYAKLLEKHFKFQSLVGKPMICNIGE